MINKIKHVICSLISVLLCLLSIIIGLGLLELYGIAYRNTGDTKYIAYAILSTAVSIAIFCISIKLAIHRTKEDKQELYNKLDYKPDRELMNLIKAKDIEAIKERYEVKI